jgi:transcriptional regulator with XRE-family HTH domain
VTAKKNNLLKQWELGTQRVLRAVRVERGVHQRPLSRQLGRAENYVTLIETGQRKCSVAEACEIAHALGADPGEVLMRIAHWKA